MAKQKGTHFKTWNIANSPNIKGFQAENVYNLKLINQSNFEITIQSEIMGSFVLPAKGDPYEWNGHPEWPADIAFTCKFLGVAGAQDNLLILYSQSYGICSK